MTGLAKKRFARASSQPAGGQAVYLGIASNQTESRSDADLARYDVLIMQVWEYGRIAAVKALNPRAKFLAYKNMAGVATTADATGLYNTGISKVEALATPAFFLVDSVTELPVAFSDFPDIFFGYQGSAAYQNQWSSNVIRELRTYGFDGVFADDVNDRYLGSAHLVSGALQDPTAAPGATLTDAAYQAMTRAFLATVKPRFTDVGLLFVSNIANSVPIGTWTDWISLVDGSTREFYTKFGTGDSSGNAPVYPAGINTRFIDPDWVNQTPGFHEAANAVGHGFLPIIYSAAADTKSMRYARASFLLDWDNNGSRLSGLCWDNAASPATDSYNVNWTAAIGTPLGVKYNVGGTSYWARRFTGGYVILNATASAHTFDLTGSALTLQGGGAAGASVAIGAGEAMILTGTPPPETFGKSAVAATANNNGSDSVQAALYAYVNGGTLQSASYYMDGNGPGSGTQTIKAVVYADNNGVPGALLATSVAVTVTHGQAAGWVPFAFANGPHLPKGSYWLGMIFSTSSNVSRWFFDAGATNQWAFASDAYSDGPASTFPSPSYGNVAFSVFATVLTDVPASTATKTMVPA